MGVGHEEKGDAPEDMGSDPDPPNSHIAAHRKLAANGFYARREQDYASPTVDAAGHWVGRPGRDSEEGRGLLNDGPTLEDDTYPPASAHKRSISLHSQREGASGSTGPAGLVGGVIRETLPSFLFSLAGGILAGELLEKMQGWTVFIRVEELFILVPILMNLKGNLEMNLAARMSTSANVGDLDVPSTRRALVLGNMFLLQVQALIVSFLASLLSFGLGMLSRNGLPSVSRLPAHPGWKASGPGWKPNLRGGYYECAMVLCAGMLAASLSSAILGSFMCALVIMCRKMAINPDNVATPVAGSLGDLTMLLILGLISSALMRYMSTIVSSLLLLVLVLSIGLHVHLTIGNSYVRRLLSTGWTPLVLAMTISSGAGLVLERFVNAYEDFALVASVATMVSGNTGAVFVSRIATAMHSKQAEPRKSVGCLLFGTSTFTLCVFLLYARVTGQSELSGWLAFAILISGSLNTIVALVMAPFLCDELWKREYDPDICALPLLTSCTDVTGQLLLVLAYKFANAMSSGAYTAGAAAASATAVAATA